LLPLQACLREIHASILRKHLHRLEHPGAAQDVVSEKEDENRKDDEMHYEEGQSSFLMN